MDDTSEKRMLMCRLAESEHVERGQELAEACKQYVAIELEKKEANEEFKERLDDCKQEKSRLAQICKSGEESRAVECRWIYDHTQGLKSLVRQDTGEVVEQLTIQAAERQTSLLS